MSWFEYEDMWEKAQKQGKYRFFAFDLVNSKKIHPIKGEYERIHNFLLHFYNKLKKFEKKNNIVLLTNISESENEANDACHKEPLHISGDFMGVTTIKDVVPDKCILCLFRKAKKECGISYTFHYAIGKYETNLYSEGLNKYYRGYCLAHLDDEMKKNGLYI